MKPPIATRDLYCWVNKIEQYNGNSVMIFPVSDCVCVCRQVVPPHSLPYGRVCTNAAEAPAKRALGVLMYLRNAALYHLPKVWINESSIPASAAEVAAPILKLCPAYWSDGRPMPCRVTLSCWVNHTLITVRPSCSLKKGPWAGPLILR